MLLSNIKPQLFRINLDNDVLKDLYLNQKLSACEVSDKLGVNRATIYRRIHALGINRNRSEILRVAYEKGRKRPAMLKADNKMLKHLYIDKEMTPLQIAKELGYSSSENVILRLRKMGLIKGDVYYHGGDHPSWKGGKYLQKDNGYILLWRPEHYRANSRHYVLEHIVVWEEYHHRKLPKGYVIHHLNGIKNDNKPSNLVAMKAGEHIHQAGPFKKKVRELEIENRQLKRALENSQMIFYVNDN